MGVGRGWSRRSHERGGRAARAVRAIGEVGGAGGKSVAWDGQVYVGVEGGKGRGHALKPPEPRADKNGSSLTPPRCCWGRRIRGLLGMNGA